MELEKMSNADLISLVRRQEQELAEARAGMVPIREVSYEELAQQGGGELPQDERAAFDEWWAKFESAHPDWRYADAYAMRWNVWQARAALAQRAASVPAQVGQQAVAPGQDPLVLLTLGGIEDDEYGDFDLEVVSSKAIEQLQVQLVHGRDPVVIGLFAAPVPAARVQPDALADTRLADAKAEIKYWKQKAVAAGACQPDIGRDAALVGLMIEAASILENAMFQSGGMEARAVNLAQRMRAALATQAAPEVASVAIAHETIMREYQRGFDAGKAYASTSVPEVASVPDAGDGPVYWSVTYQGEHTANVFRTKELAQATVDRLNLTYRDEDDSRGIVPLYTRPQPAPAVLPAAERKT